jgi:hypothetical protein
LTKPISPNEIAGAKSGVFPDFVIEAVNELITENYTSGRARFTQDDVITKILSKTDYCTREWIFAKGWLNFEEIYEAQGWEVVYDKPGYNESYKANFTFTKRGR